MAKADNWGSKARIGIFIVSSEAVPEAEWWAMMPAGVSVHAARVTAPTPWARWASNREAVELEADLERGAKQFAAMRLSAVVIAHSSSSIAGGAGWDNAVIKRLSEVVAPDTTVTTNGRDCQAALRALKVERPFWYSPHGSTTQLCRRASPTLPSTGFTLPGIYASTPAANGGTSLLAICIPKAWRSSRMSSISVARCVRSARQKPTGS